MLTNQNLNTNLIIKVVKKKKKEGRNVVTNFHEHGI